MRKFIVIGTSAGGVEALRDLIGGLPSDFDAAVFVTLHMPPASPSVLADILNRAGPLKVVAASDGARITAKQVYCAVPDRHLVIENDIVRVWPGPRENRHRPSIDVLFRTAARSYGKSVIGVLLTGGLDDGVAGLQVVKSCGGLVVVQDPSDAVFPDLPRQAVERVQTDSVLPLRDIAPLLLKLTASAQPIKNIDTGILKLKDEPEAQPEHEKGSPSIFTCPECSGTLWQLDQQGALRFRCRVGHAYSQENMLAAQNEATESAMWAALRALEEQVAMDELMAFKARSRGHEELARSHEASGQDRARHAEMLRTILLSRAV